MASFPFLGVVVAAVFLFATGPSECLSLRGRVDLTNLCSTVTPRLRALLAFCRTSLPMPPVQTTVPRTSPIVIVQRNRATIQPAPASLPAIVLASSRPAENTTEFPCDYSPWSPWAEFRFARPQEKECSNGNAIEYERVRTSLQRKAECGHDLRRRELRCPLSTSEQIAALQTALGGNFGRSNTNKGNNRNDPGPPGLPSVPPMWPSGPPRLPPSPTRRPPGPPWRMPFVPRWLPTAPTMLPYGPPRLPPVTTRRPPGPPWRMPSVPPRLRPIPPRPRSRPRRPFGGPQFKVFLPLPTSPEPTAPELTLPEGPPVTREIALVLDASGSVGGRTFSRMADNLARIVGNLCYKFSIEGAPSDVRVAIVVFASSVREVINFRWSGFRHTSVQAIKDSILSVKSMYRGGMTATGPALRYCYDRIFTDASGMSTSTKKRILLVTDGRSNTGEKPEGIADMLYTQKSVHIFPVGVGPNVNLQELLDIRKMGNNLNFLPLLLLNDFTSLNTISQMVDENLAHSAPDETCQRDFFK